MREAVWRVVTILSVWLGCVAGALSQPVCTAANPCGIAPQRIEPTVTDCTRAINAQSGTVCSLAALPFDQRCRPTQFCKSGAITNVCLFSGICTNYGSTGASGSCHQTAECSPGLVCSNGACKAPPPIASGTSPVNGPCVTSLDCNSGLKCRHAACSSGAAGESCNFPLDCNRGLRCRRHTCS